MSSRPITCGFTSSPAIAWAGSVPPRKVSAQNLVDTNDYRTSLRALLLDMQAWLTDGHEPPESVYPMISKDQLVTLGAFAFPHLPGVNLPHRKREVYRADFSSEPPKIGAAYPTLIPQVDQDGNETSGIRMPEIQVPLASYTGGICVCPALARPTNSSA